jgi:hypothetical protein
VVSRLAAWGVAAAIAIGVLWSDAILYHETNPIPTQRYREALALDKQFAGRGPAFTPDFDEYMFTAFRRTHVDGVGFAYDPPWVTVKGGGQVPYGNPVDLDSVELSSLERTPLIIARTSPEQSRPPSNFRLVHDGLSWRVWERSGPAPLQHLGVLGNGDPSGVAPCSALRRLGAAATRAGTHLVAAERPSIIIDGFTDAQLSPRWPRAGDGGVIVAGAGRLTTSVRIPHGDTWRIWLRGDVDRPLTIAVDNRVVGTVGYQSGGIGNYILPVRATLTPGRHVVSLYRGGGSLHPGDGNNTIVRRMVLEPAADREQLVDIAADRWHELCGRKLDWIEVASPGTGSRSATS